VTADSSSPEASQAATVAPERLFAALDGCALRVGNGEWRVQVYGVIDEDGRRWVQLILDGARPSVLTLKLRKSHSPSQAVNVLSSWLADPSAEKPDVQLHVA